MADSSPSGGVGAAIRYIFVLSFLLILVAYYLGSTNVIDSLGRNVTGLVNATTGRNAQGQFAGYPH
jgi:hypothetical protein